MASKTFAHGWATLSAFERPVDDSGVVFEWSDDWMLGEKLERLLLLGAVNDQLLQGTQAVARTLRR